MCSHPYEKVRQSDDISPCALHSLRKWLQWVADSVCGQTTGKRAKEGTTMSPTRAQLESAIAKQYGFDNYEAFRTFFAAEFGKGYLRQLEAQMKKREQEEQAH
jgi:tRNA U54 and U55 pseudouridine synthase Pus10